MKRHIVILATIPALVANNLPPGTVVEAEVNGNSATVTASRRTPAHRLSINQWRLATQEEIPALQPAPTPGPDQHVEPPSAGQPSTAPVVVDDEHVRHSDIYPPKHTWRFQPDGTVEVENVTDDGVVTGTGLDPAPTNDAPARPDQGESKKARTKKKKH